jgi:phosphoglycerol transferase MdoB-like AlkP superfamily enzyme
MIARGMIIGGWEIFILLCGIMFFTGFAIVQKQELKRPVLRWFGIVLLATGGFVIAVYAIAFIFHELIKHS